jgi:AcrR family transcriptional regulator
MAHPSAEAVRRPRADAVRNRERVLEAAKAVFSAGGPDASLEAVARRAGVGIGTLYRHFPTKESLYEAIVSTRLSQLLVRADEYARDADPGSALCAFLREFATQAAAKQDLFDALNQSGIDFKSKFSDLVETLMARIDLLRQRAVEAGAIRADVATADIINLVVGSCHAAGHSGIDAEGLQRLVGIVIAGLQPVHSA